MASGIFGGIFGADSAKVEANKFSGDDEPVILTRDDVSDFNEDNILPQPAETLDEIRKWLHPTAYDDESSEYNKHISSHLAGTGQWLLASPVFQTWHSIDQHGLLWIRGIPGSGKSVFAATLIHHLAQEGVPVLYFFFRQIIDANNKPVSAIRDWLAQILKFSPPLQLRLKGFLDESRSLESISIADLWSLLRTALSYLPKAYCIVDALDEMNQDDAMEDFLQHLSTLSHWRPSDFKIVITSRPVPSVEIPLRLARSLNIRLEEDMVDADIAVYVRSRLSESAIPPGDHESIQKAVPGRANGLFLYAKLAMDAFLRPGARVKDVLKELPDDLNVMYDKLLREHARRSGVAEPIQRMIMQWVTHANRPMRLLELAEMISFSLKMLRYPEDKRGLKEMKQLVRAACGPLLENLPDETICVVHHSLTEFLNGSTREVDTQGYPILEFGPTHNNLALACLAYLRSGYLDDVEVAKNHFLANAFGRPQGGNVDEKWLSAPLLRYAVSNWHIHAKKAASIGYDQTEVNIVLDKFFFGDNFRKWGYLAGIWHIEDDTTPLLTAIVLGLKDYTKHLLERAKVGEEICVNKDNELCLPYAARQGNEEIVGLLLQYCNDLNTFDHRGFNALHHAAMNNCPGTIVKLLDAGADASVKDLERNDMFHFGGTCRTGNHSGNTAFHRACDRGHEEASASFVPYLRTSEELNVALHTAVRYKMSLVAEKILDNPLADVNARLHPYDGCNDPFHQNGPQSSWDTPLFTACNVTDPQMIKLLLDRGADPNSLKGEPGSKGKSPLHTMAAPWGSYVFDKKAEPQVIIECFELLLAAGANVHQLDQEDNTPLHDARDAITVRILLDAGADPNAFNKLGQTLLHTSDNTEVIQTLLEDSAVRNRLQTTRGDNILLSSLNRNRNQLDKAIQLVEAGAYLHETDANGDGVFHYLARLSEESDKTKRLVESLLSSGGDFNHRNLEGETPLHVLTFKCRLSFGESRTYQDHLFYSLLGAGAQLDLTDKYGQTPLYKMVRDMASSSTGSSSDDRTPEELCQKMTAAGALLQTTDANGYNLLQGYVAYGGLNARFVNYLVGCGINPHHTDEAGNTLWHLALGCERRYYYYREVEYLFDAFIGTGLSPDRPDIDGKTPLHLLGSRKSSQFRDKNGEIPLFHTILGLQKNLNHSDKRGVTVLHLASTFSEWQVRRLLETGADPRKSTHEGLTALHIATKNRQTNIVGMLIEALMSSPAVDEMPSGIDSTDSLGRTPLYYACASGNIETVKLLVQAGAKVQTNSYEGSAWQGCVEYEKLHKEMRAYRNQADLENVMIADQVDLQYNDRDYHTERIHEILDILAKSGGVRVEAIDEAITSAAQQKLDFIVECLLQTRKAIQPTTKYSTVDSAAAACLERIRMRQKSTPGDDLLRPQWPSLESSRAQVLLGLRDPAAAEKRLMEMDALADDGRGMTNLHRLVSGADTAKLARLATPEVISKLESPDWAKQNNRDQGDRYVPPLLIHACSCTERNMDVVQILVESAGVNLNACTQKSTSKPGFFGAVTPGTESDGGSVLHALIRGGSWWQISEALPYLVKAGASMEVRDDNGLTPLNVALEQIGSLTFNRRTVETLIKLGSNVDSVDDKGISCLARASKDAELMRMLLQNGATVTPDAISQVINSKDLETLEAFLSHGADPNIRRVTQEKEESGAQDFFSARNDPFGLNPFSEEARNPSPFFKTESAFEELTDAEAKTMYPLHYVARKTSKTPHNHADRETYEVMARTLVRHGANTCARYRKTTVLHHILKLKCFLWLFQELPAADLEQRDASGETLLLAAAHRENMSVGNSGEPDTDFGITVLGTLAKRGADIHARDYKNQNVLHHLVRRRNPQLDMTNFIIEKAPNLVNQACDNGITPLHLAAWRHLDETMALLDAGADPFARDNEGNTALHYLLWGRWYVTEDGRVEGLRRELFKRLIATGADVNARNVNGESPAFFLFRHSGVTQNGVDEVFTGLEEHVFEFLVEAGVDLTMVNHDQETLLHVVAADKSGSNERSEKRGNMFRYLVDKGLDVLAEDKEQRTPLDIASALGQKHIMALFDKNADAVGTSDIFGGL
ncbi:ankyrin repeat-containing protein [Colletotrichum karsti]|uniref:Ankyrin repeat-containing protein n=1 Tax=Colletotrichum karsti TaxID=1095194 RepID=A0A9P6I278_9PEZI|nr:ankyrin repeat-containing protein [Colletotrichum karsti]KAF9870565.1 ankyrin repeat-containing protein [Colletotrichum karsti]